MLIQKHKLSKVFVPQEVELTKAQLLSDHQLSAPKTLLNTCPGAGLGLDVCESILEGRVELSWRNH